MVRELGRHGFLQKVSIGLCRDGSDLIVILAYFLLPLFLSFCPLMSPTSSPNETFCFWIILIWGCLAEAAGWQQLIPSMLHVQWNTVSRWACWGETVRSKKWQAGFRNVLLSWDREFLLHLSKIGSQGWHQTDWYYSLFHAVLELSLIIGIGTYCGKSPGDRKTKA